MTHIIEARSHSDDVSGCYVLDDDTIVHWSEGRSSEIDVIRPDGHRERHSVGGAHPLRVFLAKAEEAGETGKWRSMTPIEEAYHDAIRNTRPNVMNEVSTRGSAV
jgi:hypothetical protein